MPNDPPRPARPWRIALATGLVVAALTAVFLDRGPLAGTEPHRAMTAHQMVESGEWLVPRLYGRVYLRKPPGHYWVLALAESVGGAREWVWRLPSALAHAGLGALLAGFAARWFSGRAGLAAALAFGATVALWSQARSADIDALNTFCTAGAALVMLDLAFWPGARAVRIAAGGLLAGLAFLAKGPAGLPVLGAVFAALVLLRWRAPSPAARPRLVAPLLCLALGAAAFGAWAGSLASAVSNLAGQLSGVDEVAGRVTATDLFTLRRAAVAPFEVLLYDLPLVIGLPLAGWVVRSPVFGDRERALVRALAVAFGLALLFGLAALMSRPRYHYPALPLLVPLVGVVAAAWERGALSDAFRRRLAVALAALGPVLAGVFAVYAAGAWWVEALRGWLLAAALLVVPVAALTAWAWLRGRPALGAAGLAAALALASLGHAVARVSARLERSSLPAAHVLREAVGDETVLADWLLWHEADLFFYADVEAELLTGYPPDGPGERWLALNEAEYRKLRKRARDRIAEVVPLEAGELRAHLVRLAASNPTPGDVVEEAGKP